MRRQAKQLLHRLTSAFLLAAPGMALAEEPAPYWVFLRDRGDLSLDAKNALVIAESRPAESWARRATVGATLPEERDLPLWEPYVMEIARDAAIRTRSRWFNAVSIEATNAQRARIAALPFVGSLRPVATAERASLGPEVDASGRPLGRTLTQERRRPSDQRFLPLDGGIPDYGPAGPQLSEINVPPVHALGFTGNRVRTMMLDTGFRKDHSAFNHATLVAERDFVFADGNVQNEAEDDPGQHRHGTGCWAVAGGNDPGNIVGPAFGAPFYLAKTEDIRSETQAEEDFYVAALEWADSVGVRVTSASLSYVCFDDGACWDPAERDGDTAVITRALDIAAARGILCVNAAGNYGEGVNTLGTPADADSMLAVGAVDSNNQIAWFSSRGPTADGRIKPEVVARGVDTWWADADDPDAYGTANGTSLSTPLIGGASALLFEAHPEWGPMDLRAALLATADRHGNPNNAYGYGRANVLAALQSAPLLHPYPFSLRGPADGTELTGLSPLLSWQATEDGDSNTPVTYRVSLREAGPGGGFPLLISAGTDTTLQVVAPLAPETEYLWEVLAEDAANHRRISRQTWSFTTPAISALPGTSPVRAAELLVQPNPFDHELRAFFALKSGEAPETARWTLLDAGGRRVAGGDLLGNGGVYALDWDTRRADGGSLPGGVYYLEVAAGPTGMRRTVLHLPRGAGR